MDNSSSDKEISDYISALDNNDSVYIVKNCVKFKYKTSTFLVYVKTYKNWNLVHFKYFLGITVMMWYKHQKFTFLQTSII